MCSSRGIADESTTIPHSFLSPHGVFVFLFISNSIASIKPFIMTKSAVVIVVGVVGVGEMLTHPKYIGVEELEGNGK